MSTNSKSIKWI